jgi:hypothetical protein
MKIFKCDDPIDIAVLIPPEQLTVNFPLEPTSAGLMYGQDVYFMGFPFGMYAKLSTSFELVYPFGFAKKGIFSADQFENNIHFRFLDGYNIFGLSGAPVVFRGTDFVYKVMGVVAGFKPDYGPVLVPKEIRREDVNAEDVARGRIVEEHGKVYKLEEARDRGTVILNTGIVTSIGIEHAVDLIHRHPIGPKTADNFKPVLADVN